eukprot:CAMPEP_0181215702 /NCGR_PEP_ID=MMETSP1096-20121128/26160_1 /TAXON_ID=156174 ORGANISM="Chrysochromulina ericina, Strain CCMP281" /NCGR_SAMPLE_ID=MMETSP1096 /ASSEMBLY_ACC=CAM_ASM_000453 /LENGTH=99 /DNA_ID=CAMNT_0023307587 /DNA_START=132 /DNA_END=431 /DNA_ORIENTATION=+
MSEESVMSSRLRDLTEFTEAEGRDDTHQLHETIHKCCLAPAASTTACADAGHASSAGTRKSVFGSIVQFCTAQPLRTAPVLRHQRSLTAMSYAGELQQP